MKHGVPRDRIYRASLDALGGLAFWVDANGRIVDSNANFREVMGYSQDVLSFKDIGELGELPFGADWPDFWNKVLWGKAQRLEGVLKSSSGRRIAVQMTFRTIETAQGPLLFVFATPLDVSDEEHADLVHVYETQRILDEILHVSLQPICMEEMLDRALDVILSSPSFALLRKGAIFLAKGGETLSLVAQRGLHPALLSLCSTVRFGQCLCGLAAREHKVIFTDHVDERHETVYDGMTPHGHYCVPILSHGELLGVFNTYVPEGYERSARDETMLGMVSNVLALAICVRRSLDELEYMARRDALTHLPNRMLFYDRLEQAIVHAKRNHLGLSVFFIDLDRFKQVNDGLGHETGDALLVQVAKRLLCCVRESDTVARLGGDEFTMVLAGVANRESAGKVARKVIQALKRPFTVLGHQCRIGASIGIAVFPDDGSGPEALVRHADQAMYEAKKQRQAYAFYQGEVFQA